MKVTDYIIQFLEEKNVSDIFGYPGAVVCHLMDSANKSRITSHENYHEQAAAFAACGYAQATGKVGVAYANVGPGFTNLVSGIANAWFDSIPCIFIVGQVDQSAMVNKHNMRQKGIQELHAVEVCRSITKYAVSITDKEDIVYELEYAYYEAVTGRKGPVLIEIPADIQRADIDLEKQKHYIPDMDQGIEELDIDSIWNILISAERPCILVGNGVKQGNAKDKLMDLLMHLEFPCVTSLPAVDVLPYNHFLHMGYIGMNAHRYSNFVLGKCDLILALGTRMDLKQVGTCREKFAVNAQLLRVDIDANELEYKVKNDETALCMDVNVFLDQMLQKCGSEKIEKKEWLKVCNTIKEMLCQNDLTDTHRLLRRLGNRLKENTAVVYDVGQHMVYGMQALELKEDQNVFLSLGLASMGYALPAGLGIYYGTKRPVCVICGDGGFQMNMQELQCVKRDHIPMIIVVLNNHSLGMIREFQERNFNSVYVHSVQEGGYVVPDISKISAAYDMEYHVVYDEADLDEVNLNSDKPTIIELIIEEDMCLSPRMGKNKDICDMLPEMERTVYDKIMKM